MIWKISLWSKCWPVLLLLLTSAMDKVSSVLELSQKNEFWESIKSSSSPKISIGPTIMETKEASLETSSGSSRLIRLEEEISRLNHKFSLQDSKNKEYDKTVDFIKEIKIKQTESESNQKSEIETLKGIVSGVKSKEETRDDEMKQLKGRLNQIESKVSMDQHHTVKRHNSITSKPSTNTRPSCTLKNACAFDYKNSSISSDAFFRPDKTTTICIPKNACAFDFKNPSASASYSDKIKTSITPPSSLR